MPQPTSLAQRDHAVLWHPYTQMQTAPLPVPIVRGEGSWLIAEDGTRYLDGISSWWVNLHGHANAHIARRVSEQLQTLEHVLFAGFTHPAAVELAEQLLEILPQNQARVFYSDNGSTAVEVALKMVLQYFHNREQPERRTFICFRNSYHGDTFGAMSVSSRGAFTAPFWPLLFQVEFIDVPVPGREAEVLGQLDALISRPDVAGFIFEPLMLGTAGMVTYSAEVLDEMIRRCHQHGVLCIADEVMTGFGRLGHLFATDYLTEQPDIMCFSKGLTGGTMAMGLTTCAAPIYEAFLSSELMKALFHGHSYTANPVACAAALASLALTRAPECTAQRARIATAHAAFRQEMEGQPGIREVRHLGTVLAVEYDPGEDTSYFSRLRDGFYQLSLEHNVVLRPLGNVVYLLPPYCTTNEELDLLYTVLRAMRELVLNFAPALTLPEYLHD
ncbi:adenosylmethionine--8-amino-7-oxononanoate transaminase [Hymenobacter taeanensis]|uniref:Adenosylmethionine-8-amino-7-oxononanoate aminotransferase n=1 Tax=Hymenobacter taeanensis TaxID=2735321 RepID=A0A6M6BJE9_9BACT|nr:MULTISPECIES: adenosylmethionine--8-amino-7-oxononanoate transaminase [Hymenobacter]QJX48018.1 adenosylmethionine--8-amino-7-oxononanoate transaminase [Hymenobacter taeanensis]UOQ82532.1 adenosylmethionine--8-amino-7-oxononanoate transaminase [Hymenobacter sp. 5414T-23]